MPLRLPRWAVERMVQSEWVDGDAERRRVREKALWAAEESPVYRRERERGFRTVRLTGATSRSDA